MPPKADNQGKRWSKEDITKIETMLDDESSHDDIAKELKRSTASIQPHICALASKMLNDDKEMDEVTEFTGLSQEVIEKYIKAKEKKESKSKPVAKSKAKPKSKTEKESDSESEFDPWEKQVISLLTEIRDSLKNKKGKDFSFDE